MFKKNCKTVLFLSNEEVNTIVRSYTAEGIHKTIVVIVLYTGFRISEVYNLQWEDVDSDKNTISVIPKHGFTSKDYEFRTVPLNKNLREVLQKAYLPQHNSEQYIIGNSKNYRQLLNTIIMRFGLLFNKRCKFKNVSFHTLRHTFASHLVINGISLFTVTP